MKHWRAWLPYVLVVALAVFVVYTNTRETHARVRDVCSVNQRQWHALDAVGRHFVTLTPANTPQHQAALDFQSFLNVVNGPRPHC